MGWNTNGYTADDFSTIINRYFEAFNAEFGAVSEVRFKASREYELFYSSAQIDMQYQAIFSELFTQISTWMIDVNYKINSPSTTNTAIQQKFKSKLGYDVGIKPMIEADAGKIHIAIDYVPAASTNNIIAEFMAKECVAGGIVSQGDIIVPVSIGGQQFPYKWVVAVAKDVTFKLTITVSRTSAEYLESEADIAKRFIDNFNMLYKIGYDIEPESYYEINRDAKYASDIKCEYSLDGGNVWVVTPHESLYSDKFTPEILTKNIIIVRP